MGPLPEIQGGNGFIGIMPDNPTAMDFHRDSCQNQGENFTESVNKHGSVGFQNPQTFGNPLIAP